MLQRNIFITFHPQRGHEFHLPLLYDWRKKLLNKEWTSGHTSRAEKKFPQKVESKKITQHDTEKHFLTLAAISWDICNFYFFCLRICTIALKKKRERKSECEREKDGDKLSDKNGKTTLKTIDVKHRKKIDEGTEK